MKLVLTKQSYVNKQQFSVPFLMMAIVLCLIMTRRRPKSYAFHITKTTTSLFSEISLSGASGSAAWGNRGCSEVDVSEKLQRL